MDWIIGLIVDLGCAALFYSIGVYAQKSKKPMGFWSGKEVKASELTDVEQYNWENAVMWKVYSLWYVAAAVAGIWDSMISVIILMLSCTVGLAILIVTYKRIYNRYKAFISK